MKVIVAGSRSFNDFKLMVNKLDSILINQGENVEIVSGNANGADKLGEKYATEIRHCKMKQFPADWDKYGKSAGYIRNKEMADYADACIVFWDGKSKGTKHMIDIANESGLKLKVITYE